LFLSQNYFYQSFIAMPPKKADYGDFLRPSVKGYWINPVRRGKDEKGNYYQYKSGKKYHYTAGNARSRTEALRKASNEGGGWSSVII
jgi:hypothetical protein